MPYQSTPSVFIKLRFFIFLIGLTGVLLACKKENDPQINPPQNLDILGSWSPLARYNVSGETGEPSRPEPVKGCFAQNVWTFSRDGMLSLLDFTMVNNTCVPTRDDPYVIYYTIEQDTRKLSIMDASGRLYTEPVLIRKLNKDTLELQEIVEQGDYQVIIYSKLPRQ